MTEIKGFLLHLDYSFSSVTMFLVDDRIMPAYLYENLLPLLKIIIKVLP